MTAPIRPLIGLAVIAAIEGVFLLVYAIFDIVEAIRVGTSGPEEVSNTPALLLSIALFALIGVGMLVVGFGWWRARRWSRAPFILAQILGLVIGVQLAMATGTAERTTGIAVALLALVGLVLTFSPQVTRAITE